MIVIYLQIGYDLNAETLIPKREIWATKQDVLLLLRDRLTKMWLSYAYSTIHEVT